MHPTEYMRFLFLGLKDGAEDGRDGEGWYSQQWRLLPKAKKGGGGAFKATAQEDEIIFCVLASIKKQCASSGGGGAKVNQIRW